ncbi:MAG: cell division protein FtsH, partial [Bryobacteraceae bacterium]|nr:cell division protein FtsH [Bryobacteraceae bacterium]
IDNEVRRLVVSGYQRAKDIIDEHADGLVRIAEALLEREVLDGNEIKQLIAGVSLPPARSVPKLESGQKPPRLAPEPAPAPVAGLREGENPQPA